MKRNLKYFEMLLNNPAALSHREFNSQLGEWAEYLKAHPGKYEMSGKGWETAHERIQKDLERRDSIWDEFEEIEYMLEATKEASDEECLKVRRIWLDFMKKYRLEYELTDEIIAEMEDHYARYSDSIKAERVAQENLRLADANLEAATDDLAAALFEASDKVGKPITLSAFKMPKRNRGN